MYYLPPLAMLTVVGLIPRHHALRPVDENVTVPPEADIDWVDVVLMTGLTPNEPFAKRRRSGVANVASTLCWGPSRVTLFR